MVDLMVLYTTTLFREDYSYNKWLFLLIFIQSFVIKCISMVISVANKYFSSSIFTKILCLDIML